MSLERVCGAPREAAVRVGLVWTGSTDETVYFPMIKAILNYPGAALCVHIRPKDSLVHSAYARLEDALGKSVAATPEQGELQKALAAQPTVMVEDINQPSQAEQQQLAVHALDIALCCGPSSNLSVLASLTVYGVWTMRIAGNEQRDLDLTAESAYFSDRKLIRISLLKWPVQHAAAELLCEAVIPLRRERSLRFLREQMARTASELIDWKIQQAREGGLQSLHASTLR